MINKELNFRKILSVLLPGLFFSFTLFIFAPTEFYLTHSGDFWFSYVQLLPALICAAVVSWAVITFVLFFLPKKASIIVETLIIALTILMYVQGNYMVKNYGTLNGADIDWSRYQNTIIINSLIWILAIAAVLFFLYKFKDRFRGLLRTASGILLCIEIASLAVVFITKPHSGAEENRYLSRKNEFTLSSGKNTVVFLLDCFDAQLLVNLHKTYSEYLDDVLENFTFYRDTVGGATRTKYAIPFIFTGRTNTEEISYQDYLKKAYSESVFIKELRKGNYDAGLYTNKFFVDLTIDDAIENISTGKAQVSSRIGLLGDFMKLIAFRYVPDAFAKYFWLYSGDFDHWKAGGEEGEYAMDDIAFYQALLDQGLNIGTDKNTFRFYHLNGPHGPYTMDENVKKVTSGTGTEAAQALGCFKIIETYIQQMKNLGLYDHADFIIMADHGYGGYSKVEQNPVFLVKPAGQKKAFSESSIPLSYKTMPSIFADALRGILSDPDLYKAEGDRLFYQELEFGSQINITEYVVRGFAWDKSAIKVTGTVYHNDSMILTRAYKLGEEISFGGEDAARRFIKEGFFKNWEDEYTWTDGKRAEMIFDIDGKYKDLEVEVSVFQTFNGLQPAYVYANDHLVTSLLFSGKSSASFIVPAELVPDGHLDLVFQMPGASSHFEIGMSDDRNVYGLGFQSVRISSAEGDSTSEELQKIADKLQSDNYQDGMAFFWKYWKPIRPAELADGNIDIWNIESFSGTDPLVKEFADLGIEDLSPSSHQDEKPFLLIPVSEFNNNKMKYNLPEAFMIHSSDNYVVFGFDSYKSMYDNLFAGYEFTFDNNVYLINGKDENGHRELFAGGSSSYGPYITLWPGSYEVTVKGSNLDKAVPACTTDVGKNNVDIEIRVQNDEEVIYTFQLPTMSNKAETLIRNYDDTESVILDSETIKRLPYSAAD